jgi:hypothetical protein
MGLARYQLPEDQGEASYTAYRNHSRPIAPEMATQENHSPLIDIWDFGYLCEVMAAACTDSAHVQEALLKVCLIIVILIYAIPLLSSCIDTNR